MVTETTTPVATSTTPEVSVAETAGNAAPATESSATIDGGLTIGKVNTEPEIGNLPPVNNQVPAVDYERKFQDYESKIRQYQSDRDKAEAYTKNLVKQVLPLVSMDELGNIIGLRNEQSNPQATMQEIIKNASMGDEKALTQLAFLTKEQAKSELKNEFMQERSLSEAETQIKKDFPHIVTSEGNWDESNPVIKEAQRIVQQEYAGQFNVQNPVQLRAVMEMAEARIIKQSFPDIEQRIKNEVLRKTQQSGASMSSAIPASGIDNNNDVSSLTSEQLTRLQKEGYKQDDFVRIAKIVKQAQKEGGFYL